MLVVFIVVPKNSGLSGYKNIIKKTNYSEIIQARGEDIPFWIEQLAKKGEKAIMVENQGKQEKTIGGK